MGEVYLIYGEWLINWDATLSPNATAQRIATAKQTFGNPKWVDVGNWTNDRTNWTNPHWSKALIDFFHSYGIKCICHIPVDQTKIPLANAQAMVDFQMNLAPSIDGFFLDGVSIYGGGRTADPSAWAYFTTLTNYIKSKGKIVVVNPGTKNISADTCLLGEIVCFEASWEAFVAEHPDLLDKAQFMGLENNTEFLVGHTIDLTSAVADTQRAWSKGIAYFEARESVPALPSWWEQYLAAVQGYIPPPLAQQGISPIVLVGAILGVLVLIMLMGGKK